MSFTITVEIPALDRLCGLLERGEITVNQTTTMEHTVEVETPAVETPVAPVAPTEAPAAPAEPPKAEPVEEPAPAPEPVQEAPAQPEKAKPKAAKAKPDVTLEGIMRAAAQLRDEGKLEQVTGLFPAYGIRKLSDLTDEQLARFAGDLRGLGAKL